MKALKIRDGGRKLYMVSPMRWYRNFYVSGLISLMNCEEN
jgi:hypothetical protein